MLVLNFQLLPFEPSMLVLYAFPVVVVLSWVRNYQTMAVMTFVGNIGVGTSAWPLHFLCESASNDPRNVLVSSGLALVALIIDGFSREIRPLDPSDMFAPQTSMLYVGPAIFLFTVHYVVLPM